MVTGHPAEEGNDHVASLINRLRHRGWRLTAQRRAIAEAMTGEHVHLTADEVLDRARGALPEVSRATVYNTLNEMVSIGEVLEIPHPDGRKRYDPNIVGHHHLLCVECGRILDVHIEEPHLTAEQQHGFEVLGVEVTFHARCPGCA